MNSHLDLGLLEPFHTAGILDVPDVQVAAALTRVGGRALTDPDDAAVGLGAALCVRALRAGSVCVDLRADPQMWAPDDEQPVPLPWPDPDSWISSAADHPLVAHGPDAAIDRPLRLVGDLLYLQRYWLDEQQIRTSVQQRGQVPSVDAEELGHELRRLFPAPGPDRQRLAAATAALRRLAIIAGGPGTGKTTTVARIVALLRGLAPATVALAAPTGKAAARLQEAVATALQGMDPADQDRVGPLSASTLHRLLGWRPDSRGRFRHDRTNPLPHDVVIVDETSMVSLPMMARLLEAVRPDARLILVGDPDQLASIDAGAVLGDLVGSPADEARSELADALRQVCPDDADAADRAAASGVVVLDRNYRFAGAIAGLAAAIRAGDADQVLEILQVGHDDVQFLDPSDPATAELVRAEVVAQTRQVVETAAVGDAAAAVAALEAHRVLCAHRQGPFGVGHWDDQIAAWTEHLIARRAAGDPWYVGRPLLVTANDYTADLYNGDTGIVVDAGHGQVQAVFARGAVLVRHPVSRLDTVTTLRAMTIHRGQGSQFDAVTVVLPPPESRLLTRELLYTAVTRARSRIRIVGTQQAVRAGVQRQVRRASGLQVAPD
ncbi:MAG: exodeoxyribonuclease V subunit alpha [Actinobacteria bacterium]|nr:exodeoxyribonuclease V subunit alpha [Actinomycetota bacterium]MCO5299263.1 exodeoxyribonuclease V subunit alpha [Candidatus Nanopelagicales bacterium]MCB9427931.1 exodeoxyribonuclease V subunit alpha [Actinomycetota bacterium]HPE12137.1 exodeoxyribonuclease V subunit alpha [Actinomycetota bacterium]HPQ83846.1 exodeoxyribonuclease V subunit alpha [Actinomycetota bacterium]